MTLHLLPTMAGGKWVPVQRARGQCSSPELLVVLGTGTGWRLL